MSYQENIFLKKNVSFLKENFGYIIKGPLGSSSIIPYNSNIKILFLKESLCTLESKKKSLFILYKKLIYQKFRGVLYGYKVKIKLEGVGYIAEIENNVLILKLGFCNAILIKIPDIIKIRVIKRKKLVIIGSDLNIITQFAANIRKFRKPERYKGKGVLYLKEKVNLKIGKKN